LVAINCPNGLISINSNHLQEVHLFRASLSPKETLGLAQCSSLKNLFLDRCDFPDHFDLSSIFRNFPHLEVLDLIDVSFSRMTVQTISRDCQRLKSLSLIRVDGIGDDELLCLVGGCQKLRTLKLFSLDITDATLLMLINHHPRIPSIEIGSCQLVSVDSAMRLLREITIPQIFNTEDPDLRDSAIQTLTFSIPFTFTFPFAPNPAVIEFLSSNPLLERLVGMLSLNESIRTKIVSLFQNVARCGYQNFVIDAGAIPVILTTFHSFSPYEKYNSFLLFHILTTSNPHHLLTTGVLSIFQPDLLQVRPLLISLSSLS
jgi:hypothetical protein